MTFKMPSDAMRRSLEDRTQRYRANLLAEDARGVLEYLTQERRLSSEALDYFQVGYTGSAPEVGDPKHRVAFPYLSWNGPLQIRFRSLEPDPGAYKYLGAQGVSTTLFNTLALRGMHQTVYITEGEIDCITAWMCGLPAVGVPGAENWKKGYWRLFRHRRVVILADAGDAGESFGKKVSKDIEESKIVSMPEDDVNDFFCRYGRDELRKLVGAE